MKIKCVRLIHYPVFSVMKDGNCVSSLIRAIEYELAGNVARVAHGLFCGCPIKLHEIQDIFQEKR